MITSIEIITPTRIESEQSGIRESLRSGEVENALGSSHRGFRFGDSNQKSSDKPGEDLRKEVEERRSVRRNRNRLLGEVMGATRDTHISSYFKLAPNTMSDIRSVYSLPRRTVSSEDLHSMRLA